jgi:hypothetical protein
MPGCKTQAAIIAMIPTNDSMSMDPYPIRRACPSRMISFGVVPEEINE